MRCLQEVNFELTPTNNTYNFATPCFSRRKRNTEKRNVESSDDLRFADRISLSGILHLKSPSLVILPHDKLKLHDEPLFDTLKKEVEFGSEFFQINLSLKSLLRFQWEEEKVASNSIEHLFAQDEFFLRLVVLHQSWLQKLLLLRRTRFHSRLNMLLTNRNNGIT